MGINFLTGNILRPDLWTTGSGSFTGFNQNGLTQENERVNDTNPFGVTSVVWETRPTGANNDDGGWNTDGFTVDPTKTYRFSVWVRRTSVTTSGTFYLGFGGSVIRFSDGGTETNPYWNCSSPSTMTQNQWYLYVGHIFPSNYPYNLRHPNTGVWTVAGGRVGDISGCNVGVDCKFVAGTTSAYHRCYHYYCTDNTTRLQFYDPRVDLCDGTEPSMTQLLAGTTNNLLSTSITPEGAAFKEQKIVATGGDIITYNGEWKIHRFNNSGTFTVTSFVGENLNIDYLMVGGGGGGGMDMGGGGGGGGVLSGYTTLSAGSYSIVVGGGGAGAPAAGTNGQPSAHQYTIRATAGSNTTFNGLTAYGGGYGASSYYAYTPDNGYPGNGGCGGGPSGYSDGTTRSGGTGVSGQGYAGGNAGPQYYSGGGGGAGAVGTSSTSRATGGAGFFSGILGRPFYWGGGGGGSGYTILGGYGGIGGGGGGAVGDTNPSGTQSIMWGVPGGGGDTNSQTNKPGGNGGTNTGGGGGGGSHYNATNAGGNGGSGIVIIRYKYR